MTKPKCCDIDMYRRLGQERIEFALKCKTREDWEQWKENQHAYPFVSGDCWTFAPVYAVEDYAAECGFFIDGLGFDVNAFWDDYAMFTNPDRSFFFSVMPASEKMKATSPESFTLELMIKDIHKTVRMLMERGINFEKPPSRTAPNSALFNAVLLTPSGIKLSLWGIETEHSEEEHGGCCIQC